jgi:Ca2+-binding RTX toxin-like protein
VTTLVSDRVQAGADEQTPVTAVGVSADGSRVFFSTAEALLSEDGDATSDTYASRLLPPPDADGDGVPDSADACPAVAASTPDGCPVQTVPPPPTDSDSDGVPDATDACPQQAAATPSGCPLPGPGPGPRGATDGADLLNGTTGPDQICGLLGNDTINGLAGNDTLFGDGCGKRSKAQATGVLKDGNDKVSGGDGDEILFGAGGNDSLNGGKGNDWLFGGRGNDKLTGGPGTNRYEAGAGNDTVSARNGKRETVDCGSGKRDKATVDRRDKVRGCEKVRRPRR